MLRRILTILVSVPIIFACTFEGGLFFFTLVAILSVISLNEFYNMLKTKGLNPYYAIGNVFTLAILVFVYNTIKHPSWESVSSFILTAAVIITFSTAVFIRRSSMAIANIAITILGIIYIGWLFSYLILLRALTPHGVFLFLLMFAIWATDTMAYVFGKKFGRRQLSPYISPNKTIEGAIAGFVMAVITSYFFGAFIAKSLIPDNWLHFVIIGIIIGVFGQLSDLAESLIKRDAGVKDSSNLVPGHGGVLDRMDSFIFTAPILYYYIYIFHMYRI